MPTKEPSQSSFAPTLGRNPSSIWVVLVDIIDQRGFVVGVGDGSTSGAWISAPSV